MGCSKLQRRLGALAALVLAAALPLRAHADASGAAQGYAPSDDPVESAAAYERALRDGIPAQAMELFTPGSRVLLKRAPLPHEELERRAVALAGAGPMKFRRLARWAVVTPIDGRPGVLPVLLERADGTWRVDEVEMQKAIALGPAGAVIQIDDATPYAFGIEGQSIGFLADLGSVDLFGEDPAEAIARLERAPKTARTELRLAEILLRDCWLPQEALPHYDAALKLEPKDWEIASTFAHRAIFLGIGDRALPVLEPFGDRAGFLIDKIHIQARRFDLAKDAALAGMRYRWLPRPPRPEPPPAKGDAI